MKRTLILALCALLLSCCTKTPQQKAEALVKDAMLKSLILPDTYQPVETKLDSAFSPYQRRAFGVRYFQVEVVTVLVEYPVTLRALKKFPE